MDRDRRYNLRSVVGKSRRIIEEDIAKKLIYYGITKKADPIPAENLQHLSEEDKEIKIKLEKAIEKEKCAVTNYQKAVDRYIRHVGFTFINRIAALRAMEVRGLITETILRKNEYGGMSLRERSIHEKNHDFTPDQVLEESLKDAFREVTIEIKVLFDLESEYSIVFPSSKALRDIIQLLSDDVTEDDWMQDDIIGWIYQYYNEDARQEFKKSKRSPSADDIPVVNQFYTPHWVVRVLTDNTLGRLWLEQKDRCPYFNAKNNNKDLIEKREKIPDKSNENEFKGWLKSPNGLKVDNFCSYLVPLMNEPPKRKIKRAKDIKVLDPACGSGHFLIYAFDVLFRIYLEDEPEIPEHEIPGLILENNLFGIDIDLRAVQLAALSLYLKAKSYNPSIEITKMNLVCADSHIAPGKKRKEFLNRFSDSPELQEIFAKTFEDLNNTNELGSLLKVRKPFEKLLENVHQVRFSINDEDKSLKVPKIRTINEMLQELKEFEQESMENHDMGSLLFATEAEKSVGLLSILSQKYDTILMNPPYGKMPKVTKDYLQKYYPITKNDLYAAFMELTLDLNESNGFMGMLTSRTFMFLRNFIKIREDLLWNKGVPELLLDTGFGVLDGATVETAATVIRKIEGISDIPNSADRICTFNRVTMFDTNIKEKIFRNSFYDYLGTNHELWFNIQLNDLTKIPFRAYAYWAPHTLIEIFKKYSPLDKDIVKNGVKKISDVKVGLQADTKRFNREFWEVETEQINQKWFPFPQGGNYRQYYSDITQVVFWEGNGKEIKKHPKSYVRNEKFYFRQGLTWSEKPSPNKKYFAARLLPDKCIFTTKGPGIFIRNKYDIYGVLAYLCSNLNYYLVSLYASEHDWTPAQVASSPIHEDLLKDNSIVLQKSKEIISLLKLEDTGNEVSTIFIKPWLLQILTDFNPHEKPISGHPFSEHLEFTISDYFNKINSIRGFNELSLAELAKLSIHKEEILLKRVIELQRALDTDIYNIYEISKEDRNVIEKELELRKGKLNKNQYKLSNNDQQKLINEKIEDHIKRLISFYVKLTIEEDEDGIVPLDELLNGIKVKFAIDFGEERVKTIETEIYDILGKSLKDWVSQDYFDYHVTLYKRRPIYWQFTSFRLGKGRKHLPGAFSSFVDYHKLNRDIIPKMIAFYLKHVKDSALRERDRIFKDLEKARTNNNRKNVNKRSKDYEDAANIVDELESFEELLNKIHNPREDKSKLPKNPNWVQEKIKEVRDDGWNPVIDYGVRVNIEALKEAQILPKSADRVK